MEVILHFSQNFSEKVLWIQFFCLPLLRTLRRCWAGTRIYTVLSYQRISPLFAATPLWETRGIILFMDRRLNIAFSELVAASHNKERRDALCFAVLVKSRYTNSRLYHHSVRELKQMFHIGQDKLKKVLKDCVRFGYAISSGSAVIFRSLSRKGEKNILIETQSSLKETEKLLREQLILSKIRQVEFLDNSVLKAYAKGKPATRRDLRNIKRYDMNTNRDSFSGTITRDTLARTAGCSIRTVDSLIGSLKRKREVRVRRNIEWLPSSMTDWAMNEYNAGGNPFFACRNNLGYYLSLPNTYSTIF